MYVTGLVAKATKNDFAAAPAADNAAPNPTVAAEAPVSAAANPATLAAAVAASPVKPDLEMASFLKIFGIPCRTCAAASTFSRSPNAPFNFCISEIKVPIDLNDVS